MIAQGAYGETIRHSFHFREAPSLVTAFRPGASFVVTGVLREQVRLEKIGLSVLAFATQRLLPDNTC